MSIARHIQYSSTHLANVYWAVYLGDRNEIWIDMTYTLIIFSAEVFKYSFYETLQQGEHMGQAGSSLYCKFEQKES